MPGRRASSSSGERSALPPPDLGFIAARPAWAPPPRGSRRLSRTPAARRPRRAIAGGPDPRRAVVHHPDHERRREGQAREPEAGRAPRAAALRPHQAAAAAETSSSGCTGPSGKGLKARSAPAKRATGRKRGTAASRLLAIPSDAVRSGSAPAGPARRPGESGWRTPSASTTPSTPRSRVHRPSSASRWPASPPRPTPAGSPLALARRAGRARRSSPGAAARCPASRRWGPRPGGQRGGPPGDASAAPT